MAEAEILADRDHACSDPAEQRLREVARVELRELRGELHDENLVDTGFLEELESAFERHQELDPVAEDDARVWPERDHRRRQPGSSRHLQHSPMTGVHPVEASEGDGPVGRWKLLG